MLSSSSYALGLSFKLLVLTDYMPAWETTPGATAVGNQLANIHAVVCTSSIERANNG